MSKQGKRARRAMKQAAQLQKHIDGIIGVLQRVADDEVADAERELLEAVAAAEETASELEYQVALVEAQDIPMGARH